MNSSFSQPTFLSKCPFQTAARMNFGWYILDSSFSWFLFPFTVFYSKTCNCELWMVKLWIPTFLSPHSFQNVLFKQLQEWILDGTFWIPPFLVSFPFHSFLFKNLQLWALDGKIVNSNFSQPTFLSKCPFQTAARMNFGWYILDSSFSWFLFPFTVFYSKTCNCERWMVKLWIPTFLSPHSFQNVLFKQLQEWILDTRFSSILRKFSLAAVWQGNFERKNWNYKGLK